MRFKADPRRCTMKRSPSASRLLQLWPIGALALCCTIWWVASVRAQVSGATLRPDEMRNLPREAQASVYRLGPMDKVRLKVLEWRASRDETFEWKALSDEYVIGPTGKIALPLVGEVAAEGLSPRDLGMGLAVMLQQRLGLATGPDISVDITSFRPFYIVGHVDRPGEYGYRPNLTVLQAVSISGGHARRESGARGERDDIAGEGDVRVLGTELQGLLARRARLDADLAGAADIRFPDTLRATNAQVALMMEQERQILDSERRSFATQTGSLEQLKSYLESEIAYLQKLIANQEKEADLAQQELGSLSKLAKQGLTTQPRRLGAQRNLYQLDGERTRLEMNLTKTKQDLAKTNLAIAELNSKRSGELMRAIRQTQTRIDEVTIRLSTARELLSDIADPGAEPGLSQPRIAYAIIRHMNGALREIAATETTPVLPGDTIKVKRQKMVGARGQVRHTVSAPTQAGPIWNVDRGGVLALPGSDR